MPYPGHLDTCSGVCLLMLFIKNSLTHSDQAGTLLPSYWNLLSCEGKLGILKSKGPESKPLVLVCFSTFLVLGRDLFFFWVLSIGQDHGALLYWYTRQVTVSLRDGSTDSFIQAEVENTMGRVGFGSGEGCDDTRRRLCTLWHEQELIRATEEAVTGAGQEELGKASSRRWAFTRRSPGKEQEEW